MPPRFLALVLVVLVFALTGCQALAESMGVAPAATAPAYSGVGVLVVGSENTARLASRADLSGNTGAEGSGSQTADQSLEIPAEAIEAMVAAAKDLIAAGNPAAAGAILGAIPSSKPKTPAKKPEPSPAPVEPAPAAPAATSPPVSRSMPENR